MIDSALAAEAAAVSQPLPLSFTGHVRCTHSVKWLLTLTDKKEVRAGAPGQEMERERELLQGRLWLAGMVQSIRMPTLGRKEED